ncbi:Ser/Thr protein kinase [Hahella sp. CCB-MM4]|uniref:DUF547 domain-containing protein n=1 Tax=Hahella sp. (strain CCB-MM4) TaxID=1926491 RepID=UPI000B9B65F9|nr:DUF547 domain-containing protein [Hahella sp. CCB-MM4]OZG73117.1 Ser/Thr protein kinase [Hahella sp. CCB-MM4]
MNLSHLARVLVLAWTVMLSFQAVATETGLWKQSNEGNPSVIDHSRWDHILSKYLEISDPSGVHLFRYVEVSAADRTQLEQYIDSLAGLDPRKYSRAEQKAYWINLYNALTVDLILKHYPTKSIKKLGKSFFSFGPWDDKAVQVAGVPLTLNDIEHKILRPIWQDKRIHYAVNCASYSCPNLAAEAYTSDNMERLLEQGARDYINHERGVSLRRGDLLLSSIYKWYREDFGNSEADVLKHLERYAGPELKKALEGFDGDIDYDYDWRLNEVK